MKESTKGCQTQNPKELQNSLNAIELLIKSNTYRELGNELLANINPKKLSPKQLAQYHYLNARYQIYTYREDNDLENLETANDFLDDMMATAYQNPCPYQIRARQGSMGG